MKSLASLTAFALSALLCAPAAFADKMSNDDAAAMKQLAQANLNEIEAGKLAASKAQSPDVKQFGQNMVEDHGKMLEDLKSLAKRKDVALPDKAALKDLAQLKLLERKSGADFDREFMEQTIKDHDKAVKETNAVAAKAKDPDFKAAAQQASRRIETHLQLAQRISKSAAAGATASTPVTPSTPATPSAPATPSTPPSGTDINPKINFSK
jgi:putative membrane protein